MLKKVQGTIHHAGTQDVEMKNQDPQAAMVDKFNKLLKTEDQKKQVLGQMKTLKGSSNNKLMGGGLLPKGNF